MSDPYTHAAHYKRCYDAAQQRVVLPLPHVQIMRQGVFYCATIKASWTTPTGLECWTVETTFPEQARFTVPCKNVRLCGGPDCSCEPQVSGTAQAQRAGSETSPEGVTCM